MQQMAYLRRIDRLFELLRNAFPHNPPQVTPELRQTLDHVVSRCGVHAIFVERDLGRYVCVAYQLGPDFDTIFPAASAILGDETRPADERLTLLEFWADQMLRTLEGAG